MSSNSAVEIRKSAGHLKNDKHEGSAVFADLYADLCRTRTPRSYMRGGPRNLPAFTHDELLHALKQMAPGKAADSTGVVAEMLKVKCDELHDLSLEMFSDIFRGDRRGVLKADPMVRKRVI